MRVLLLASLALAASVALACGDAATGQMTVQALVDVDLGSTSTAFTVFQGTSCDDLLARPIVGGGSLDEAAGEGAPVQVVEGRQHVFGNLPAGAWAFFVLAVDDGPTTATSTIAALDGHELGRGCVESDVVSESLRGVQVPIAAAP